MLYEIASEQWVNAFKDSLNSSKEFAEASADWQEGPVVLCLPKVPEIGIDEDRFMWLGLDTGKCDEAILVTSEEAKKAPFVITTDYARWKQVFKQELDPIKGMMQGKLKLVGHLPTIVRRAKAALAMIDCANHVPTKFPDE